MKALFILAAIVVFGVVSSSPNRCLAQGPDAITKSNQLLLQDLLRQIGDKFDCRFTIEIGLIHGDHDLNPLTGQKLRARSKMKSLELELQSLSSELSNFSYTIDPGNPKVVHIVDIQLAQQENPLGTMVKSLMFNGNLFDLVGAIAKEGPRVSANGAVSIQEAMIIDSSTKVSVNEQGKTVRQILTDALNLSSRGHVLWIAETEIGRNSTTYIHYLNRSM